MALLLAAALGLCLTGCGDDPAQGNLGTLDPIPTVEETPPVSSSCKPDAGEPLRCKPVFTTKMLVLNGILPGTSVEEVMEVSNTGTGPCDFKEWELIPCSMTGTGYHCDGNHFSGFEIVSAPPVGGRLRPGESTAFELVFKAPDEVGLSVVKTHHLARLTPWFSDPCDEGALRAPPWEGTNGVNLRAIVEGSFATITPPFLDFGVVGTTCPVQTRALVVRNAGPTSFKVTKLTLKGCNDIVSPTPGHTLPLSVAGFGEATLAFDYVSKGEITTDCKLVIETTALNMPSSTIPVWGRGVLPGLRTEYFTAHAPQKLDALFVVDNSNSMTDKQAILTEELPKLALQVMNAGQDVHLAVTTTDAVATEGAFIGTPAFVTSGDDVEAYANTVKVGTQGALNEKGFLSAWLALTGPNSTDDGVNAGFLRPDANLAVVFISDEDDHSPDSVEMWIERFVGLKKSWRGSGVAIHSVVATHDPCGEVSAIGTRYVTLANAFAGQISDICSGAFAEALTATGLAALSASERYYLTAPPKPHSVEIHVNDELWFRRLDMEPQDSGRRLRNGLSLLSPKWCSGRDQVRSRLPLDSRTRRDDSLRIRRRKLLRTCRTTHHHDSQCTENPKPCTTYLALPLMQLRPQHVEPARPTGRKRTRADLILTRFFRVYTRRGRSRLGGAWQRGPAICENMYISI